MLFFGLQLSDTIVYKCSEAFVDFNFTSLCVYVCMCDGMTCVHLCVYVCGSDGMTDVCVCVV